VVVKPRQTPGARLMVIGAGPGAQEDVSGRPSWRSGQLLDQMLAERGRLTPIVIATSATS